MNHASQYSTSWCKIYSPNRTKSRIFNLSSQSGRLSNNSNGWMVQTTQPVISVCRVYFGGALIAFDIFFNVKYLLYHWKRVAKSVAYRLKPPSSFMKTTFARAVHAYLQLWKTLHSAKSPSHFYWYFYFSRYHLAFQKPWNVIKKTRQKADSGDTPRPEMFQGQVLVEWEWAG